MRKLSEQIVELYKNEKTSGYTNYSTDFYTEFYYSLGNVNLVRSYKSENFSVSVLDEKRFATVNGSSLDETSLKKALKAAKESSLKSEVDPSRVLSEEKTSRNFKFSDKNPNRDKLAKLIYDFVDDIREKYNEITIGEIGVSHDFKEKVYVDTNELELVSEEGRYEFSFNFVATRDKVSTSFNYMGFVIDDLDKNLISYPEISETLDYTIKLLDKKELKENMKADIILTPNEVANILSTIRNTFIGDFAILNDASPWKDSIDKKVAGENVNILMKKRDEDYPYQEIFSKDGYLNKEMKIIENGVLKNFIISDYVARRKNLKRSENTSYSLTFENGEYKMEELLDMKRGLFVNRLSGGNTSVSGEFSGVAKNSFLIEYGKITDHVEGVMVSFNVLDLLKNITCISKKTYRTYMGELPFIRVKDVVISSN